MRVCQVKEQSSNAIQGSLPEHFPIGSRRGGRGHPPPIWGGNPPPRRRGGGAAARGVGGVEMEGRVGRMGGSRQADGRVAPAAAPVKL